jgi:2-polyprenyl-3-methyl-5-hydroxy-6-metoxy-1,4-benzoquinol methylase
VQAVEEMDKADCDPKRLRRTYARFPVVNELLSGWRRTYRQRLRPLLAASTAVSVLDIGCGSGDVARSLVRWARQDGFRLNVTAIDPDERAFAFASQTPPVEGVVYRKAHSSELVAERRKFDVVISNHILHHLDPEQLAAVLRDSESLSRGLASITTSTAATSHICCSWQVSGLWAWARTSVEMG